jgi:hypothetical protein
MPIVNGPYRDPEVGQRRRRRKAPSALVRLKRQFTYEKRMAAFREVYGREPGSDEELEAFAEEYILELYNSGDDDL